MIFQYFRKLKLRRAFRSYIYKLGPALTKRYGLQDQYTVRQIQKTIEDLGLDARFITYAVALYRYEASVNTIKILNVDQAFLDMIRQEIAISLFDEDFKYSSKDVLALGKKAGWRGGSPPDWLANKQGRHSL